MKTEIGFYRDEMRPVVEAEIVDEPSHSWMSLRIGGDADVMINFFRPADECREIARETIQALQAALVESEEGGAE